MVAKIRVIKVNQGSSRLMIEAVMAVGSKWGMLSVPPILRAVWNADLRTGRFRDNGLSRRVGARRSGAVSGCDPASFFVKQDLQIGVCVLVSASF